MKEDRAKGGTNRNLFPNDLEVLQILLREMIIRIIKQNLQILIMSYIPCVTRAKTLESPKIVLDSDMDESPKMYAH